MMAYFSKWNHAWIGFEREVKYVHHKIVILPFLLIKGNTRQFTVRITQGRCRGHGMIFLFPDYDCRPEIVAFILAAETEAPTLCAWFKLNVLHGVT